MLSLEEKKALRYKFMHALYETTEGISNNSVRVIDITDKISPIKDDSEFKKIMSVVTYLDGENLLAVKGRLQGFPAEIAITHAGVVEVESAMENPNQATEHFLPVTQITNIIGSMVNSNIQQANINSQQTNTYNSNDLATLESLLNNLTQFVNDASELHELERKDVIAEIETIRNQSKSSRSKKSILKSSLDTISEILKGASGSAVWDTIKAISVLLNIA